MADIGSLLGAAGLGGNIGKAIVQLELDTKKYATELQGAQAQTMASTSAMGSSTSKFGSLASAAFLGVGVAAVAGLGASVGAAIEAQEAQQRLHNTIENAPQLSSAAEKAFLDQAEAIRKVTGADDEAIISGEALLGNMGLTQDAITELAPLVVDLATKYDIDLQAAFKAVGKAATGSTGALSRYVGAIEKGATPAETLQNVLDKLGGAAGFAAEQAKNEPWVLLKSDMEELAERIGNAVLPIIQELVPILLDLVDAITPLLDLLGKLAPAFRVVAEAMQYVLFFGPKVAQLFASLGQDISSPELKAGLDNLIKKTTAFGDVIKGPALDAAHEFFPQLWRGFGRAEKAAKSFADMSTEELEQFAEDSEKSFKDWVESGTEAAHVTRREFVKAFDAMVTNASELNQAMKRLAKEKWVNDEFIQFLAAKGPEWLVRFSQLNEEKQRKMQQDWERTNTKTSNANQHFETMIGLLDDLDTGTTRHTVEIRYKYVGFDPSKPGMSPQQR